MSQISRSMPRAAALCTASKITAAGSAPSPALTTGTPTRAAQYVQEVTSDAAKKAGLKAGDMFYYFDEKRIETFTDLQGCLKQHKPGDKVSAIVVRDGKTVELKLTLVESAQ